MKIIMLFSPKIYGELLDMRRVFGIFRGFWGGILKNMNLYSSFWGKYSKNTKKVFDRGVCFRHNSTPR